MMSRMSPPGFYESGHLRADGNLSYIDFIRVVERVWSNAHPGIPMYATGTKSFAVYPCIVYGLEMRRPHPDEPKKRRREEIATHKDENAIIIDAQRFQNLVTFTVFTEQNPQVAEELIEVFEDFMMEFTPLFKRLGVSEFVYSRRMPDGGENRQGVDVITRTVAYLVTIEKVIKSSVWKLNDVYVDVRRFLEDATPFYDPDTPYLQDATPITEIIDQFSGATPIS